jgi:hypothetical protein
MYRCQWRSQFMTHRGDEFVLQAFGGFQLTDVESDTHVMSNLTTAILHPH